MKRFKKLCISMIAVVFVLGLAACSGSSNIQGTWHARNADETEFELVFHDKTMTIDGEEHEYTQNKVGTQNGIKYYSIKQYDEYFTIVFPEKGNMDFAILIQIESLDTPLEGNIIFTMGRESAPSYQETVPKYAQ